MGLYGIPGRATGTGQPQADAPGQQPGGVSERPAGSPDVSDALAEATARLMKQMETPEIPQPEPVPISRKILAALGDGLMNYASILAGGGPVGTPAGNRIAEEQAGAQAQRNKAANEGRDARNRVRVAAFEAEQRGIQQAASDAAEADRQAARDKAELDKAKALRAIDEEKWYKQKVAEGIIEMSEQGFELPDGLRVADISFDQFRRMRREWYVKVFGDKQGIAVASIRDIMDTPGFDPSRMQAQVTIPSEPGKFPTTSIQTNSGKGTGGGAASERAKRFTPGQLQQMTERYEGFDPWSPEMLGEDGYPDTIKVGRAIKELTKDFVPINAAMEKEVRAKLILRDQAQRLLDDLLAKKERISGAGKLGWATEQDEADFRALAASAAQSFALAKSRGDVSDNEFARLLPIRPEYGKLWQNNYAAIKGIVDEMNQNIAGMRINGRPIPKKQMDQLRKDIQGAVVGQEEFEVDMEGGD